MARLKIKERLFYLPGAWSINLPVKNGKVEIYDIDDFDLRGSDLIFEETKNNNGHFSSRARLISSLQGG